MKNYFQEVFINKTESKNMRKDKISYETISNLYLDRAHFYSLIMLLFASEK